MLTDSGSETSALPQAQSHNSASVNMPTLDSSQPVTQDQYPVTHKMLKQLPYIRLEPHQPKNIIFTKDSKSRGFLPKWFDDFKWLEYDEQKLCAYCFVCRQASAQQNAPNISNAENAFTSSGFSCCVNARKRFREHEKKLSSFDLRNNCHASDKRRQCVS